MRAFIAILIALAATPAAAQIQMRPTDPPLVTAVNESWFLLGEPIQFAGELYYPAGARVFFNGNTMVRSGHYNGVPLYVDTTVEPYSIVMVPVSRGLLQPYERLRRGDLAGTTGSRPPSFPVRVVPEAASLPAAGSAPTSIPQSIGAISVFTPEASGPVFETRGTVNAAPAVASAAPAVITTRGAIATAQTPESNDGIWIAFQNERWVIAGPAVRVAANEVELVGQYSGFPVFARRQPWDGLIYLPTNNGLMVPYRLR